MIIGDLSADIGKPQNPHSQQVADLMMEFSLMELLHHFWQHWKYWHVKIWLQKRQGRAMQASSNYFLGTYRHRFNMVEIRGLKKCPSDHLLLCDRLLFSPTEAVHQCDAGAPPEQAGTVHGDSKYTGR